MNLLRNTILGILLITFVSAHGQHSRFDFSVMDTLDQKEKLALMEKVKIDFPFYTRIDSWPQGFENYFHFIDLDNDSDPDLIYDGWSGSEPMVVKIYLNKNGEFENLFTQYININDIEVTDNRLKKIYIHNPGCCAAVMEHEYFYEFQMSRDSLACNLTEHITYHNETTNPVKFLKTPIHFEVVNSPYTLRITPKIDTISCFYPDDSKGNIVNTYQKGDRGIALAEASDETGRVWWYVVMNNQKERNIKTNDPKRYSPKFKGWMSSRYLKQLE